ncbi:hypothetical protein IWW38_003481, partial [Coemansia aciculifera]
MDADAEWPAVLEKFFQRAELYQSLRALQLEAVVFASSARSDIYDNLRSLAEDIQVLLLARQQNQNIDSADSKMELDSDEPTVEPQLPETRAQDMMQSVMTKEQTLQAIDAFVARQRKEIDITNQDEFLVAAEGRDTTCARVDAKGTSRGVLIQRDVVFNDRSALERSTTAQPSTTDLSGDAHSLPLDGLVERVDSL